MATMCSFATAKGCFAHTSSTPAVTRRWGLPGATSTSRRLDVRKLGRTRRRVTRRPRHTNGGTGTTTTMLRLRRTRSGLISLPTPEPPQDGVRKGHRAAGESFDLFILSEAKNLSRVKVHRKRDSALRSE